MLKYSKVSTWSYNYTHSDNTFQLPDCHFKLILTFTKSAFYHGKSNCSVEQIPHIFIVIFG